MPRVRTGWSARVVRLLLLTVVGLLVISLGTVVATRDEHPTPQPPSVSEIALSNARADSLSLQNQVNRLAARSKENRELESVLSETAQALERHRRMLAPASGSSPGVPAASPSATAASPSGEPADLRSLVEALARSGRAALNDAAGTTAGVAKVLAVAGTEQLTAATALAEAASLPTPKLPAAPTGQDFADVPGCPAATPSAASPGATSPTASQTATGRAEPRPSATTGPGPQQEAQALHTTLTGLQRAVYIYEAAVPRLSGKAASFAESRLQQHRRALEAGTRLLSSICGRIPVPEAAYELPAGFRHAPAAALAAVEHDLVEMYTDLTGLSDGTVRQWSLGLLPRTSLAAQHWEKP